jgi:hypothetical protein
LKDGFLFGKHHSRRWQITALDSPVDAATLKKDDFDYIDPETTI